MGNIGMAVKSSDGYTLVESLVAMTLFATVVLGLIGSFGAAFKPGSPSQKEQALILAQSELAHISMKRPDAETKSVRNLIVQTTVQRLSNVFSVTVKVTSVKNGSNPLVTLTKIIPYQYE